MPAMRPLPPTPVLRLLLLLLTAVAFSNALAGDYVYDDLNAIVKPQVLGSWSGMGHLASRDYGPLFGELTYRPVVSATYFLDVAAFGRSPFASRLLNLLLHAANVLLLFDLLRRLFRLRRIALLAAALFAVHPVVTEAVNCAGFREDLLALVFMLFALHGLASWIRKPARIWCLGFAASCWLLGLLSKESAAVLPLLAGLLLLSQLPRPRVSAKMLALGAIPFLFAAIVFLFLYLAFSYPASQPSWPGGRGPLLGFLNFCRTFAFYLALWVWPANLSIGHDFAASTSPGDPRLWVGLGVFVVFSAAAWLSFRRRGVLGFGLAWIWVTMIPMMQFRPTPELLAERYLYIPHAGMAAAMAALLHLASRRLAFPAHRLAPVLAVLAIMLCLCRTVVRNLDWSDNVTLNIRRYELWNNAAGDLALGNLYLLQRNDPARAIRYLERSVSADPGLAEAHFNLGMARAVTGETTASRAALREAIRLAPKESRYQAGFQSVTGSR